MAANTFERGPVLTPAVPDACRICGGALSAWGSVPEMHFGFRTEFEYLVCSVCESLQIAQIPADLARYYPKDYYTAETIEFPSANSISMGRMCWTDVRLRGHPFARIVVGRRYARFDWFTGTKTSRGDAILDVGCGSGRLLGHLARDGFLDLTGIDSRLSTPTNPELATRSGTPLMLRESLEEHAQDPEHRRYHLAMAHHSFEHVEDPRLAFASFARLVVGGGWLLLRVPVADSWACREYGADWIQLDAPRHLHLPTRASIARLCDEFGFRLARVVDDSGPFQIWGSELVRRGVPLVEATQKRRRFFSAEAGWVARIRAWRLRRRGLGDQACFYLQRIEGG